MVCREKLDKITAVIFIVLIMCVEQHVSVECSIITFV